MSPVLLIGVIAALLVTGCSLSDDKPDGPRPGQVERDQVIAQTAAPKLPDNGPRPGLLRDAWRIRNFDAGIKPGTAQIRLLADQLFVGSGRALTGYDPRTGGRRWHYREPGRELSGYAAVGGRMVIRSADDGADPVVTGLDADTGALRWERKGSPDWAPDSGPAWAGRIVADYDAGDLLAVDASSGDKRWTRQLPLTAGCRFRGDPETDGSVLVVWEVCESTDPAPRMRAFDPADGKQLWSKEIGAGHARVAVRRGATLIVVDGRRSALIGRDGKALADLSAVGHCGSAPCALLAAGETLMVGAKDRYWMIAGGRTQTLGSTKKWLGSAAADGRLFGVRQEMADDGGRSVLPSALEVVDPVGGEVVRMPIPARFGRKDASWVGAGDGRLVVARGHDLLGYTSTPVAGPVELAGVAADGWPDSCRLLGAIRTKAAKAERVDMSLRFGLVALERKQCTVSGASVLMEWVATTAADASALVVGKPMAGADEVQQRGSDLLVRVGRYVVRVSADEPRRLPQIVAEVASELR